MTATQAELERAVSKYETMHVQAVMLHNACPVGSEHIRDSLWQSVLVYEEFLVVLRRCLMTCVEKQTSNATISVSAHGGTSQNEG